MTSETVTCDRYGNAVAPTRVIIPAGGLDGLGKSSVRTVRNRKAETND